MFSERGSRETQNVVCYSCSLLEDKRDTTRYLTSHVSPGHVYVFFDDLMPFKGLFVINFSICSNVLAESSKSRKSLFSFIILFSNVVFLLLSLSSI